jgi:hypothetical protein
MSKRITLGSGKLYCIPFADTLPEVDTICVDENLLGYIKGGASLEYAPTFYEAKDDLGYVIKTIITEETATLKSGILTFNGDTLNKLCDTGRVTEDATKGRRILKIGGMGNAQGNKYVLCFHHEDPTDGDIWVLIVGQNQAGFTLAFAKDAETVIDAEFKCLSQDTEGTLIQYIEEDSTIKA